MPFPSVSLLDSFQRANETPLNNGGKWKAVGGTGENVSPGRIVSEQWSPVNVFTAGKEDSAYWTVQSYTSPAVAVEIHNTQGAERMLGLWCCLSTPTTSAKNGYRLRMVAETTSKTKYVLERIAESTPTTLTELTKQAYAAGDLIGMSVAEGKVRVWHKSGAGEWTELASVADATYTEGNVGITGNGNLFAARNFEAGGTTAHAHEPSATGTPKPTLAKTPARKLEVGQASKATLVRGQTISATQGSSASLSHSISRSLVPTPPKSTATLTHATHATQAPTVTQGSAAHLRASISRRLVVTQASSAEQKGVVPAGSVGIVSQGSFARLFYTTSGILEPGFPYPMPFFTGPGLINSYQHGTPAWVPDALGVNSITHVEDRAGWSTAVFKPYAIFDKWDDAAETLGHQDERFVLGGVIDTNYYQPAHTPAGAAYDAGKRKLEPMDLTFPVVGHARAGAIVMVQFFNPTPPAMYEPEPERNPGAKALGDIGQLAHDSEFGTGFRDSKGNRCELIAQGDGIWLGVIFVGGVTVGEETTPGGPLEPGDTMTMRFFPGALAGTMTKVIPDDVGFPVRVEEVFRGEGKEEVLAEHTFNVPPGQGIIQAHDWAAAKGAYPYGTTEEEPSSWAGGSKKDPLAVLGEEAPEPLPLYYKLVPNDVGFYCFASVFVGNLGFGLDGGFTPTEKRESRVAGFSYPPWEPGVFYFAGELVERFGVVYRSKGSVNHDPSDPANAAFWEVPSVGELSLPVGESPTAEGGFGVLAATNWTTAGSGPAGGGYANLLNAASHGNHMVIDYRDFGEGGTYDTTGSAVGWLDITFLKVGVRPKNELTNGETLTSEVVEPDETLGVGPKGGLGKVIVLTVSGEQVADAQNVHAPRVTDAADLYLYYNWMNDSQEDRNSGNSLTLLTGSAWAAFFESEVKRLYEAAPNGDVFTDEKKVPPLIAELRLTLTVASATPPKWKMWDEEGEDPFSLGLMLSTSLVGSGPATGDLYENGVLIGTGVPLSAADATKPGGVEFVLRDSLPALPVSEWFYFREEPLTKEIGLTFPGREPFGILHIVPIFGSHFNTLHLAYTAEFRLYFPPLIEKEEEEIRVEVDKEKEEEREEAEKEKREEQEKEHSKEKEEKESEEEREKGREEERETIPGGEEEAPEVSVEGNNRSSARVPSNKVIGKTVPNPNLPEGEFGEGGGEVGSTDPNIQADVYLEDFPEAWDALWSCLNPATHEGYRVQIESLGGGSFEVRLDKIKGEEVHRLGETVLAGVAEGFHTVALTVAAGILTLKYDGGTIITAADATFTSGRAGIEGQTDSFGGIVNFTQGGVLRDDLKRHEEPLGAGWVRLPWAANTGRCFTEAFGWVATLPGVGNVSGAYWT